MANQTEKKAAVKRPSALKRQLQNEKRRLINRSFRSRVLTAVRQFEAAVGQKEEADSLKKKLSLVYSLMDKGVKKGIYKCNKANRTKARMNARLTTV